MVAPAGPGPTAAPGPSAALRVPAGPGPTARPGPSAALRVPAGPGPTAGPGVPAELGVPTALGLSALSGPTAVMASPRWDAIRRFTHSGVTRGWSARAITAALHSAALHSSGDSAHRAESPAVRDEPMPVDHSGLCTTSAPGTSAGAAPVTTMMGSAPPARSSRTPRSTRRWPPISTRALGWPRRLPSPAARRIPATRGCMGPRLPTDWAGAPGSRRSGATAPGSRRPEAGVGQLAPRSGEPTQWSCSGGARAPARAPARPALRRAPCARSLPRHPCARSLQRAPCARSKTVFQWPAMRLVPRSGAAVCRSGVEPLFNGGGIGERSMVAVCFRRRICSRSR